MRQVKGTAGKKGCTEGSEVKKGGVRGTKVMRWRELGEARRVGIGAGVLGRREDVQIGVERGQHRRDRKVKR